MSEWGVPAEGAQVESRRSCMSVAVVPGFKGLEFVGFSVVGTVLPFFKMGYSKLYKVKCELDSTICGHAVLLLLSRPGTEEHR